MLTLPAFGKFDLAFGSRISKNNIPGLNFLNSFSKLKSFIHGQELETVVESDQTLVSYNPVYLQFKNGVSNRYQHKLKGNSYGKQYNTDLLLSGVGTLLRKCLYLGDLVSALSKSLDSKGRLKGYEGLGSISPQLTEMQRIFPPAAYTNSYQPGISPGLSGGVKYLLQSYSKLNNIFTYTKLPGESLEFLLEISSLIGNGVKDLAESMSNLGIDSFKFVPNILPR